MNSSRKIALIALTTMGLCLASFALGRGQRRNRQITDPIQTIRPSLMRLKIAAEDGATIEEFRKLAFELKSADALNTRALIDQVKSSLYVINEIAAAITESWTFSMDHPEQPYDSTNSFSFFILHSSDRQRTIDPYLKQERQLSGAWNIPADHFDQNLTTHILMRYLVDDIDLLLRDLPQP